MKRIVIFMISVLTCGAAFGLPVGNPSNASLLCDGLIWEGYCGDPCDPCLTMCDAWSIRVGFYGDYVFNRHMEVHKDNNDHDHDIEHTEIYTNAGMIAFNIWNRFDIFATLGASKLYIETNISAFSANAPQIGNRINLETQTECSWSVGARATIWECGCTSFGAEAQYFYTKPDIKKLLLQAGLGGGNYPDGILDLKYREWQIGLGISYRIHPLVPYIAIKCAKAQMDLDKALVTGFGTLWNLESKKVWGYAVGVSLIDCERASLTLEGQWADEKAVHVNGQIRF